MDTTYQIVLLGGNDHDQHGRLRSLVDEALRELGVPARSVTYLGASEVASYRENAAGVGVYFGTEAPSADDMAAIERLQGLAIMIVPVAEDLTRFHALIPEPLHAINGMQIDPSPDPTEKELRRLVAVVLESLDLLRRTRRLFISYKRSDSRAVAMQLYRKLDECGFDVFLDTVSIRPGEKFQDHLWHRMCDADIVVLLDTPNFRQSRWTTEELAKASAMSIAILQVRWPGQPVDKGRSLAVQFPLDADEHFTFYDPESPDSTLKSRVLNEIAAQVEALRSRALAARHNNIVAELSKSAKKYGLDVVVQPKRYLESRDGDRVIDILVPAVGVPDAHRCHEIIDSLASLPPRQKKPRLVYDHRNMLGSWCDHLKWLNDYLPIESVRVLEADMWLTN